ncbi:hypothetical protein SUDANB120_05778 [Streptomyces sp. enrichment culture]|uniref:hypothetical protein n=1 Tax=Streptomyces sp. enrichment culture TaxID=1795815 RepID=UPI003F565B98
MVGFAPVGRLGEDPGELGGEEDPVGGPAAGAVHGAVEEFGGAVPAAQGGLGQAAMAVEFVAVHPPGPAGIAGAGRVGEQFGRGAQGPSGLGVAAEAGEGAPGPDVEDGGDAAGELGAGQDGGGDPQRAVGAAEVLLLHAGHRQDEGFDRGAGGPAEGRVQGALVQALRRVVPFRVEGDPGGGLEEFGVRGAAGRIP